MFFLFTLTLWDGLPNKYARKTDFESIAFTTFDFERILNNDSQDPDENFFNAFNFKYSQYFTLEESSRNLNNFDNNSFSMVHLNIRSLQKNFDSLFNLLMTLKSEFKVICTTETWCSWIIIFLNFHNIKAFTR